jgi:hypothetical protein
MGKASFEKAIITLSSLINHGDVREEEFQKFFENHPKVFEAMGYKRWISQPVLDLGNGNSLIPDFVAQKSDGTWEIIELKRASQKVLKPIEKRVDFYSEMNSYISQCMEYIEFFDDEKNRAMFFKEYKIEIHKGLRCLLIAGNNSKNDRIQIHQLLYKKSANVDFQTYDDVRTHLELIRTSFYSDAERLKGVSIHFPICFYESNGKENYLFDCGGDLKQNRITIYIDKLGAFVIRLVDKFGRQHRVEIEPGKVLFNILIYLSLEIGFSEEYTFITVENNGKYLKELKIDKIDISLNEIVGSGGSRMKMIIGSDITKVHASNFYLRELVVLSQTLSFEDKVNLRNYMYLENFIKPALFGDKEWKGYNMRGVGHIAVGY